MKLPLTLRVALLLAVVFTPITYFGAQVLAAPYYPNYSILTVTASQLGSDLSTNPAVLNAGAMLTGIFAILGSLGLVISLPHLGTSKAASYLLALCLVSIGIASFWAGTHPLPNPRHNPGAFAIGYFIAPFVALWAAWSMKAGKSILTIVASCALSFIALGVIMSGATRVDLAAVGGLVQKLIAAASMVAPATVALAAIRSGRLAV